MFPILCTIGPLTVYSYGVMLALAVVICALLLSRDAKAMGITAEEIYDLVFWVVLVGIIGARIFFIFLNLAYFSENPVATIMIQKGGLAWQGSLIAGLAAALVTIKRKKWPMGKMLDAIAPYAALGQSIGRIGCFLNGCCYGREVPWGIYFPVHDARLHPAQLCDSVGLLIMFFILKRMQKGNQAGGSIFVLYLMLASAQRFIIEFFRADHFIVWSGLSIFQWVSIVVFLSGAYVYAHLKNRSRK